MLTKDINRPLYSKKSTENLDFSSSFLKKVLTSELKLTSPDGKLLIQVRGRIWWCFVPPENLPKFDENLRFFPPILEAIRTFVYRDSPCLS